MTTRNPAQRPEVREKLSKINSARVWPEEVKQKIKESNSQYWEENKHLRQGKNNSFFGKSHKQESLNKIRNSEYHKNLSGKNNPRYVDGRSHFPYPMEFNEGLKEEIRNRDDYTCQGCGTKKTYRKLDIHHIDYNKDNLDKKNLITTCTKCNSIANTNRDYWYAYYRYKLDENKNI